MSLFHDNLVEIALFWNLHFEDMGKVQWVPDELSFEEAEGGTIQVGRMQKRIGCFEEKKITKVKIVKDVGKYQQTTCPEVDLKINLVS